MTDMARQQVAFDWQGRLESDGKVTFGPSRLLSWVLLAVAVVVLLGFGYAIVSNGPAVWSTIGFVLLAACLVYAARTAVLGGADLTVTHEGFQPGRGPVVDFDRLTAISTSRTNLTLHWTAPSGEPSAQPSDQPSARRPGRLRGRGQKAWILSLPRWTPVDPDGLATWLFKLKGGPMAEVDSVARAGISRVYRLRE
jgi:hypothetical protein